MHTAQVYTLYMEDAITYSNILCIINYTILRLSNGPEYNMAHYACMRCTAIKYTFQYNVGYIKSMVTETHHIAQLSASSVPFLYARGDKLTK